MGIFTVSLALLRISKEMLELGMDVEAYTRIGRVIYSANHGGTDSYLCIVAVMGREASMPDTHIKSGASFPALSPARNS